MVIRKALDALVDRCQLAASWPIAAKDGGSSSGFVARMSAIEWRMNFFVESIQNVSCDD